MNFYTSDTHFWHKNIIKYENRPFETLEEMNEKIIESWNKVVKKEDTVYHLGDFVFGSYNAWVDILSRLNGHIVLIQGNHDSDKVVKRVVKEGYIEELHTLGFKKKLGGHSLWLAHYPLDIGIRPNKFSIHGHIHSVPSRMINQVNVGVDIESRKDKAFGQPISEKELIVLLDELNLQVEEEFHKMRSPQA